MKDRRIGTLAMIATVVIWGISFVSIEVGLRAFAPMTLGLVRFVFATALIFIMCRVTKTDMTLHSKDIKYMLVAGLIGITAYFYFENTGIQYTNASIASLVVASLPVFSFLADMAVYKLKWTKEILISLAMSVTGVIFIVGLDVDALISSGYMIGYLMMLASAVAWIFYSLASKPLFDRYSPMTMTFYQFLIGTVGFLPFALLEQNNFTALNMEVVLHVLFLGVFASAAGFYLYLIGLEKLGITQSSLYLNLIPVVTVIFGYFYLGQLISGMQMIGGGFVILSVYLINLRPGQGNDRNGESIKVEIGCD